MWVFRPAYTGMWWFCPRGTSDTRERLHLILESAVPLVNVAARRQGYGEES